MKNVVKKGLDGPGKLVGYRVIHRQDHDLDVPWDILHAPMFDLDAGLMDQGSL